MQQYKKLLLNLFKKKDGREGGFSTIKFYAKLMSSNNHFLKKKRMKCSHEIRWNF